MQTTITKLITWAQVNDSAFRHYKPDGNVLLTLAVDSPFIRIFIILMKVNWQEHLMVIITWLYYGLIFLPIEVTYFLKFSADILFNHGLNSLFLEELQSLENLSILENLAITWPYTDHPTFRPSASQANQCLISHFLASLGACNPILYIHVLINWPLSK